MGAAFCLLISSCQKEKTPAASLALSNTPTTIELGAGETSATISFTANRDWTVSSSQSWCTVSPASGSASSTASTVTLSLEPNTGYDARETVITITAEGLTQSVTITQAATDGLEAGDGKEVSVSADGGTVKVAVKANVEYEVSTDAGWIKVVSTKALQSYTVTLSVDANPAYEGRSATVTISQTGGDLVQNVTIAQEGRTYNALECPLTLEAIEDGTISINNTNMLKIGWTINGLASGYDDMTLSSEKRISIPVVAGDAVHLYGDNAAYYGGSGDSQIYCSADTYIYGNVMSLVSALNFSTLKELTAERAFFRLFTGNSHFKNYPGRALALPATKLTKNCYDTMFTGCSGLTEAPELPATTMVQSCYSWMFENCTSLTTAPELPATKLAEKCYYGMFSCCSALNYVKCLATSISSEDNCTGYWLDGVASEGTFVKASGASWSSGVNGIPSGWTVIEDTN